MIQWIPFFQWFIDLNGEAKAVIAILLGLVVYFGIINYNKNQELDELQKLVLSDSKECSKEVKKVTDIYQLQIQELNDKWQTLYNDYRDKVETENKVLTKEWERKYEILSERFDRYQQNNNIKTK